MDECLFVGSPPTSYTGDFALGDGRRRNALLDFACMDGESSVSDSRWWKKGHIPWNKNLKGDEYKKHYSNGFKGSFEKGQPSAFKGKHHTEENKLLISKRMLGTTNGFKNGDIPWNKNKKMPPTVSKAMKRYWTPEKKAERSRTTSGENSPNYGRKHTVEAKKRMSDAQKGRKCSEKNKRLFSEMYSGEGNPFYGKCHTREIKDEMSKRQTGVKLSDDAKQKISEAISGELHYNWHGGTSFEPYGVEFNNRLKKQIRTRDNHTCQECGHTEEQLGYKLCVHHIDYNKQNNNPENLISLCKSCHSQTNFSRDDWTNYFKERMVQSK